uniref:Calmodulin n=1 Tax=Octactis speculum TaxID=3111310 RepID=A0A7S2CQ32_9STRA|mmetsp:Transcript_37861/g.51242  ORF Transcript_37861/g.51242 Transcript_37861/m.51242 type:complete len:394 (+) Transcript_37861:109-1290(+)
MFWGVLLSSFLLTSAFIAPVNRVRLHHRSAIPLTVSDLVTSIKTGDDLKNMIVDGENVVAVKYWASWCRSCKRFEKNWRRLITEDFPPSDGGIIFAEVEHTGAPLNLELFQSQGIASLPFIQIYVGGELLHSGNAGTSSVAVNTLKAQLKEFLGQVPETAPPSTDDPVDEESMDSFNGDPAEFPVARSPKSGAVMAAEQLPILQRIRLITDVAIAFESSYASKFDKESVAKRAKLIEMIPRSRLEELTMAFKLIDTDDSGDVSIEEIHEFLDTLRKGRWAPEQSSNVLFRDGGVSSLNLDEFLGLMAASSVKKALSDTFKFLDLDRRGFIPLMDLIRILTEFSGQAVDIDDIRGHLGDSNVDIDGHVNYLEFCDIIVNSFEKTMVGSLDWMDK